MYRNEHWIKKINGKNCINGTNNGFSRFNFNEQGINGFEDNINLLNNLNLKNINALNPSYINMNGDTDNDIYQNININHFN